MQSYGYLNFAAGKTAAAIGILHLILGRPMKQRHFQYKTLLFFNTL
jgi:hypothetical protein